jgi:CubicO group peptidase (beta-lactamase class C family)
MEGGANKVKRHVPRGCLLPLLATLTSLPAAATPAGLDLWEQALREAGFSGVVSVQQHGKPIFEYASVDLVSKGRADGVFWIGSVSKQFAAVAALRLVEQGKLSLNEPVNRHLGLDEGALTRDEVTCTLEHLLSNTCGLPKGSMRCPALDLDRPESRRRYVKCAAEQPLGFTPGTRFEYANLGFGLVGVLVAEVSGRPYGEFLREELFEKAGMTDSGVALSSPARERLQRGQLWLADWGVSSSRWLWLDPAGPGRTAASGNLHSTASDLHLWNLALHGGKLLPTELHQELIRPRKESYGLGIVTKQHDVTSWVWHNGGLSPMGWSSHLAWVPAVELSVVVLSNRGPTVSHMDQVAKGLVQTVLEGAAPRLEPLAGEAFASEVLFFAIGAALYLAALGLLVVLLRGPRKSAFRWMTHATILAAVVLVLLQVIDFYGDLWLARAGQTLLLVGAMIWHRERLGRLVTDVLREPQERRRLRWNVLTLVILFIVVRGEGRLWLALTVGAVCLTAYVLHLRASTRQALPS